MAEKKNVHFVNFIGMNVCSVKRHLAKLLNLEALCIIKQPNFTLLMSPLIEL